MRLIDADDALQRFIKEAEASGRGCIHINTIKRILQDIDTAYDIEKVVAELEKEKAKSIYDSDSVIDVKSAYRKAIDIVRKGGVT